MLQNQILVSMYPVYEGKPCYLPIDLRRSYAVYALLFSSQTLEKGIYKMHDPRVTETYKHIFSLCLSFPTQPHFASVKIDGFKWKKKLNGSKLPSCSKGSNS